MFDEPAAPTSADASIRRDAEYLDAFMRSGGTDPETGWAGVNVALRNAPGPGTSMLADDVRSFLVESGIVTSTQLADAEDAARSGQLHVELAGTLILNIASAFTPQGLASYLDVSLRQIDAWLASGLLSAFSVGDMVLIPAWQIDSSTRMGLLHNLESLHDLENSHGVHDLGDFMYDTRPKLRRQAAATPLRWLRSGSDINPVLERLNELRRATAGPAGP